MLQNLILSASNLFGLFPFIALLTTDPCGSVLVGASMLSSGAYHLIETHKHGMPGIGYFDSYQNHQKFIWVDRICAILSIIYFEYWYSDALYEFEGRSLILKDPFILGIFGLICMGFSEMVFKRKKDQCGYILTHLIWHFSAYYSLYMMVTS